MTYFGCIFFIFRRLPRGLAQVKTSVGYIRQAWRSRWQVKTDIYKLVCVCTHFFCGFYALYFCWPCMTESIQMIVCVHACMFPYGFRCIDSWICVLLIALSLSTIKYYIIFTSYPYGIVLLHASVYAEAGAWNCGGDTYRVSSKQKGHISSWGWCSIALILIQTKSKPKHWSKHDSTSKTWRPFISFILHLTWEGTLMWNCLMIYCDWCLNASLSILF